MSKLAYLVAQHYQGRRTIYALHGPSQAFPGPPYFVGLTDQFYRLDFALPHVETKTPAVPPLVTFPNGAKLVSLDFSATNPRAGDLVQWRARWQFDTPGPPLLWFSLRLRPLQGSPWRAVWERWESKGAFVQGYPALYGLWGIFIATPPGWQYEQRGRFIVPTNTPAGDYGFDLGYAQMATPSVTYGNFASLGDKIRLQVTAAPRPTNGP